MTDLFAVAGGIGFFAMTAWFVRFCDSLLDADDHPAADRTNEAMS